MKTSRVHLRKAAKAVGALAGLVVSLGFSVLAIGHMRFTRLIRRDVGTLLAQPHSDQAGLVTPEMLRDLPEPIQRYLTYTGIVGRPFIRTVYLEQRGKMRAGPKLPWMDLKAEQWYTVSPPGFVWDGTLRLGPFPIARARDRYTCGRGNMLIRATEVYPIADASGAEMDQGALLRYLAEMIWFPSAFLNGNVAFAPINDGSASVTLTDQGRSVNGTMYIDEDGRLSKFVAERYQMIDGRYELHTWSASVTRYAEFEGLQLPVGATAVWHMNEDQFTYFDAAITELRYNERRHNEINLAASLVTP